MLRAGLSGTNWTGKTETMRMFTEAHPGLDVSAVALSDICAECPYPTVADQTLEATHWIAGRLEDVCAKDVTGLQLFDRTPVDVLAFALYAEERERREDLELRDRLASVVRGFDTVFYVAPSQDWPVGVSPSSDEVEFAQLMDSYIQRAMSLLSLGAVSLPWDMQERQRILSERLSSS